MSKSSILENNLHNLLLKAEESTVGNNSENLDSQLVNLVLNGDEKAFELIFVRHKKLVGAIARNYFRQPDQIEEVIQKTFVKAYFELKNFQGKYQFSLASWLGKIAVNICLDMLRSQKRKIQLSDSDLSENQIIQLLSVKDSTSNEKSLIERDLAEKLLAKLAAEDRFVLQMLISEERSVSEIAELIGWSRAKVKVRAFRARKKLRSIIKKFL